MYKILRIICCVLASIAAAAAIFVFVFLGWLWGFLVILAAFLFGALMVTFKLLQEKKELSENPPPPQGDFITGKVQNGKDKDK